MKAEYDLSRLKSRKNPYASKLKKPVTMRLGEDIIGYFKGMAATGQRVVSRNGNHRVPAALKAICPPTRARQCWLSAINRLSSRG